MDITKVTAAIANAKTELANAITAERKVLADPKADVSAVSSASRALLVAGKIDSILNTTTAKVEKAIKRLAPKAKRARKPAAGKKAAA